MTRTASYPPAGKRVRASTLYDARCDEHYRKPVLRGWQHLIWFGFSLAISAYVLSRLSGGIRVTAFTIYALAVSGLFGTSALYHRGNWSSVVGRRLQRADHVMIFFLIAGSATPEFLLALPGRTGELATAAMWTVTLILASVHLGWMKARETLVGAAFLILGWAAGAALPAVWMRFGVAPVVLIALGGLLYTIGAVCYHRRRPDPRPAVFGYHEVFHALVCAAATCHYVAIAVFLL